MSNLKRDWNVVPFRTDGIGYLEEYEQFVADRWRDPIISEHNAKVLFLATCMGGEAGEALDAVKKLIRDRENTNDVVLELGDTLYYLTRLANFLGYSLNDVIKANVKKLNERAQIYEVAT